MKSGEELYNKVHQSPRSPRVVLTPNLHHGRQDLSNLEARTSTDHQSEQCEEYGETCCVEFEETQSDNIDVRIQGLPHSTVQEKDDVRRETVKKLIHQIETHPNRESLMADLNKTQIQSVQQRVEGIDQQHGEHRILRVVLDLFHVTIHRLFILLEVGIVYCTCRKCLQPSERNRQLKKERYHVPPIPNFFIKKNPSHGARDGPTVGHKIYYKAHSRLKKSRRKQCSTILERFQPDFLYRDSLTHSTHTRGSGLKHNMKLGTLCLAQTCSRHRAPCHTSHL